MITLLTGKPGHGKSQYAIKMILDAIEDNRKRSLAGEPVRQIYCDIDGVNEQGFEPLPDVLLSPDDWTKTPDGSIIFYDEAQKREYFQDKRGALSDDHRVKQLEVHRHTGHDLIFMTQDPTFLHTHIRRLVGMHINMYRPANMPFSSKFVWSTCKDRPESDAATSKSESNEKFFFNKKYYKYYRSSSQHNMKARIPKKILFAIFGMILIFTYAGKNFFNSNSYEHFAKSDKKAVPETISSANAKPSNSVASGGIESLQQQKIELNRVKYLGEQMYAFVSDETIRPAFVVSSGTKCKAFNSYGERLLIDQSLCLEMSSDFSMLPASRIKRSTQNDDIATVQPIGSDSAQSI